MGRDRGKGARESLQRLPRKGDSQQRALSAAGTAEERGESLVLQEPPGTGGQGRGGLEVDLARIQIWFHKELV